MFFILDPKIGDKENLFRAGNVNPVFWDDIEKRPSSAVFKDSKGVSVDRDGMRENTKIIETYFARFGENNVKAVFYIRASLCHELQLFLKYDPRDENEYHTLILQSETG